LRSSDRERRMIFAVQNPLVRSNRGPLARPDGTSYLDVVDRRFLQPMEHRALVGPSIENRRR
jgi:hypothetical protein